MNLCVFGDSITWGAADTEQGGWVGLLQKNYLATDAGPDVYNLGVCGDRTDNLLRRFEVEAIARNPNAIIFAIGINDAKPLSKVSPAAFLENLHQLLLRARKIAPRIAFIGLTRVNEAALQTPVPPAPRHSNVSIESYDRLLRDFCQKTKVPYCNVSTALSPADLFDGLHPNFSGHKKLFEEIFPFVENLLK